MLQVSESKDSGWSRHCLYQELRTQNSEWQSCIDRETWNGQSKTN
jgi:hypothetical protein